jgi:hypothetical protein
MSSTPRNNSKAVQRGYKTPSSLEKAVSDDESQFAEYGISPPSKAKQRRTFTEAEKKIKKECKDEWEKGTTDDKKIILFLYSRGFHRYSNTHMKEVL